MKIKFFALSLLLLLPCINSWSAESALNSLIYEGIGIEAIDSPEEFQKTHGNALAKDVREISNRHGEGKDVVYIYQYKGFRVYFYQNNNPKTGWVKLVEISVTGEDVQLKQGIKLGMSREAIMNILGEPDNQSVESDITWFHYAPDLDFDSPHFPPNHEQLRLQFKDAKLAEFSWLHWP